MQKKKKKPGNEKKSQGKKGFKTKSALGMTIKEIDERAEYERYLRLRNNTSWKIMNTPIRPPVRSRSKATAA